MTTCNQGLVGDKIPLPEPSNVPNTGASSNESQYKAPSSAAPQSTQENNAMTWNRSSSESITPNEIKTSLIVNYLPQSVKERDFTNLFSMIGPLKSAKLMYDRDSGYSFGYGFVEYVNPADALRAIDTYNGYRIEHKRLKVAFSRPNTEETRNTTLYIRNLPSFYDDAALVNLIRPFGDIVQARVIRNPETGNPRGIAFVIMSTKKEATEVIQCLNGKVPPEGSHPLIVKFTDQDSGKRKNRHMSSVMGRQQTNSYSRRSNSIMQSPVGQSSSFLPPGGNNYAAAMAPPPVDNWGAMLLQDNNPAAYSYRLQEWLQFLSSGAANQPPMADDQSLALYLQYVAYLESQQQHQVAQQLNSQQQQQQQYAAPPGLFPGVYIPPPAASPPVAGFNRRQQQQMSYGGTASSSTRKTRSHDGNVIYVYGLRPFARDQELHELFSPFGQVNRVDVVMDSKTNKAKGFGFVTMENHEDAMRAVQSLNGRPFNGRNLQVRFRN